MITISPLFLFLLVMAAGIVGAISGMLLIRAYNKAKKHTEMTHRSILPASESDEFLCHIDHEIDDFLEKLVTTVRNHETKGNNH